MQNTNLEKRYWDVFDKICEISKKHLAILLDNDSRKLKFMRALVHQNHEFVQELSELGSQLGLGRPSSRDESIFLNNVFDRKTRKIYRKIAKKHRKDPISIAELNKEAMAQISESQKRRKKPKKDASVA